VSALRSYADGFSARSGIQVALDLQAQKTRLPPPIELALFRVVQESLVNIHHHSGSRTASIRLARQRGEIVLEIRDQGRGMPGKEITGGKETPGQPGVGIAGMQERLREVAGKFEMISGEQGTLVRALVPLSEKSQ
jgi:signal transduction histidine kinase